MAEDKNIVTAQIEETGPAAGEPQAVVAASKTLRDFETRQHALTRVEALKEEIKPVIWCKSSSTSD